MKNVLVKSDGLEFKLVEREWEEYHGITAAFITLNEEDNILEFIKHIRPMVKRIVMVDGGSIDKTVEIAESYVDTLKIVPFSGHFAEQKNTALRLVHTDWTLFLDPDERFCEEAVAKVLEFAEQNETDCYKFPRKEFIDGQENTESYPDRQARLFRTYCRFIRPIHEELIGWKECEELPEDGKLYINHYKKNERHQERNAAYPLFGMHYIHELGKPGEQTEDTIVMPVDLTKITTKKDEE